MTDKEYLDAVLRRETFASGAAELEALHEHRENVERLIVERLGDAKPTIRDGGSLAKGTMIKTSYDLDVPCYFAADSTEAGETLKAIYDNVEKALREDYWTEPKPSAIRLRSRDAAGAHADFHVDVVPGRFFDETETDVWLYQNVPDRERLKTNLDVHVSHVRKSGVRDAIKLMKLWRARGHVGVRNFVLELLVIDLLAGRKAVQLPTQLRHVLEQFRDHDDELAVKDPANPEGNDLSDLLNESVRATLRLHADATLRDVDQGGWERVFGAVEEADRQAALARAAQAVPSAGRHEPWAR